MRNLNNIFKKHKTLIGVDFGTSYVKMVLLEGTDLNNLKLEAYAIEALPEELVNYFSNLNLQMDDSDTSTDVNEEVIKKSAKIVRACWSKLKTNVKTIAISIPNVLIKNEQIIKTSDEIEMDLMVKTRLQESLSSNIDSFNYDYAILGDNPGNPSEQEVLIVAQKQEKNQEKVLIMENAGLIPIVLDSDFFVLKNALNLVKVANSSGSGAFLPQEPKFKDSENQNFNKGLNPKSKSLVLNETDLKNNDKSKNKKIINPINTKPNLSFTDKTVALFDIGFNTTRMLIFKDYKNISNRDFSFGGFTLTQMIMDEYGKNYVEAEVAKITNNLPTEYKMSILPRFFVHLSSEASKLLKLYLATNHDTIDYVLFAGGTVGLPNFIDNIKIDVDDDINWQDRVYSVNQLATITRGDRINLTHFKNDQPNLYMATGLGLRKLFL
jgi:Tfp pilus assembly PilM family ATPase